MTKSSTSTKKSKKTKPVSRVQLDAALSKGVAALSAQRLPDGSWDAAVDLEPQATATQIIVDHFLGRLTTQDKREGARFLTGLQLPDGGYPGQPFAKTGTLSATALVLGAFGACAPFAAGSAQQSAQTAAQAFVKKNGGTDAVVERFYSHSDDTALWLAMVDMVDPQLLPDPELKILLSDTVLDLVETRVNAGILMGMLSMGAITRFLRERAGDKPWLPGRLIDDVEEKRATQYIEVFQNPDGNWDGNTLQSGLYLCGLYAMGCSLYDDNMVRAMAWLDAQKSYSEAGMQVTAFTAQNWATAFALRALILAGVERDEPIIEDACAFLVSAQADIEMPRIDQKKKNAVRRGGWPFQPNNPKMPDSDDTGVVLAALGLARQRNDGADLSERVTGRVQNSALKGLDHVTDMQAPSGGWAAFVWGMPEKQPGPLFTSPLAMPRTLEEKARFFLQTPVELGNPPVSGLTGRVLGGLGANGQNADSPAVKLALGFLREQRAPNGVWWGRWITNYLGATASVFTGLAACHVDMTQPWIANAIAWVWAHQNADGGFGETAASYHDVDQAGKGPSMAPLTAIVLGALVQAGQGDAPGAERAAAYLLAHQQADGAWPQDDYLTPYLPPDGFYAYGGSRFSRPVEALALYRDHRFGRKSTESQGQILAPLVSPPPLPSVERTPNQWPADFLEEMRMHGDPPADSCIQSIFEQGDFDSVRQLMGLLVKNDDAIPPGLPKAARSYFDETGVLPTWADPAKLKHAHRIFTDHGFAIGLSLFVTSLPQSYACANGAHVLTQTRGLLKHARHRILETAQFIFDVLLDGSFDDGGRGIRAPQKVRLMHATVRHRILMRGQWALTDWGLPLNQEDLAGTLMTFAPVVLDGMKKLDISLTADDEEAYLHLWKVVGALLGVNEMLLPADITDAHALQNAIFARQWSPSDQGRDLARALMQAMEDYLPGGLLDDLPETLVRYVAGDTCADLLGLAGENWTQALISGTAFFGADADHEMDEHQQAASILRHLAIRLFDAVIDVQREGKETAFRIPKALVRDWSLSD